MGPWFDPDESDRGTWTGDDARRGEGIRSTYERAVATTIPYERRGEIHLGPEFAREEFRTSAYEHVRLQYHAAIDSEGRVKLLERGYLWGDEEHHQRYRAQYRRPGEPTDTEPLGEYSVWTRYQFGSVAREGDGVGFDPDGSPEERTRTLSWEECYTPQQVLLAELELVRNPPFARHLLSERDRWQEIDDVCRYDPGLFDLGP